MATIQVDAALEDVLKERSLAGRHFAACAHCLGYAADYLRDALDPALKKGAAASFRIFEEFLADAENAYGLGRAEAIEALSAIAEGVFRRKINEISIEELEQQAGFDRNAPVQSL